MGFKALFSGRQPGEARRATSAVSRTTRIAAQAGMALCTVCGEPIKGVSRKKANVHTWCGKAAADSLPSIDTW